MQELVVFNNILKLTKLCAYVGLNYISPIAFSWHLYARAACTTLGLRKDWRSYAGT